MFFPANALCLTTFANNLSRKKCQMNVTLRLKLCESQQVLLNGMCAYIIFWFCLYGFKLTELQVQTIITTHSRSPHLFWLHAETTENTQLLYLRIKRHDSPPTFFRLYAISNSTDFSVGLSSEKLETDINLKWYNIESDPWGSKGMYCNAICSLTFVKWIWRFQFSSYLKHRVSTETTTINTSLFCNVRALWK